MKKIDRSEQNHNQDQDQDQRPARPRKLQVHRETLRDLTATQLRQVNGASLSSCCHFTPNCTG